MSSGITAPLASALQSLKPGAPIELYVLDLNPIGVAETYYFSPQNDNGVELVWGGQTYTYAAISITGVEAGVDGVPEPRLSLPNVDKFASAIVLANQDLVGAKVTRIRTFADFLDGEPLADGNSFLSQDTFRVFQKMRLNKVYAEFALRPLYSLEGRTLPGRVCLKSVCMHRYRDGSSGTFDYSKATCPHVGAGKFTADGTATSVVAEDVCGKRLSDCILRFAGAPLPTRAFPGMSRTKV